MKSKMRLKKVIGLVLSLTMMLSIVAPTTLAAQPNTGVSDSVSSVSEPTASPSQTTGLAGETTLPTDDAADPAGETTSPADAAADPAGETTPPAVEATTPAEEPAPADESTAPAEETEPEIIEEGSTSFENLSEADQNNIMDLVNQQLSSVNSASVRFAAARADDFGYIAAKWFEFEGAAMPDDFAGVEGGEIANIDFPEIVGMQFDHASYGNAELKRIGRIDYQPDGASAPREYIYYVWSDEADSDLVAQVLPDGGKIILHYVQLPVDITYVVTGGVGITSSPDGAIQVDGIPYGSSTQGKVTVIPASNPKKATPGLPYSFEVEIPRGYTAVVKVNGSDRQPELGIEPTYQLQDGKTIVASGEYLTKYAYTVPSATSDSQTITVELKTPADGFTFSADLVTQTQNFGGNGRPDGDQGSRMMTSQVEGGEKYEGPVQNGTVTWTFETNAYGGILGRDTKWILDSLEINGEAITLPFVDGGSQTTTLTSGTVITVTREYKNNKWNDKRYCYTIKAQNCHENLTVTSGNLNAVSWPEYVLYEYDGVQSFEYLDKNNGWSAFSFAKPVASGELKNDSGMIHFRFKLLPGYGEPTLAIGEDYSSNITLGEDGYYYVNCKVPGGYPALIKVNAKQINVKVVYDAGEVSDAENIPQDDKEYSLAGDSSILIPLNTPIDPAGTKVFSGWKNGSTSYERNDVVKLEDLQTDNGVVTFVAQWVDVDEAEFVSYTIDIREEVPGEDDKVLMGPIPSQAMADEPAVIDVSSGSLKTWLEQNPGYEVDKDNTIFYYASITNGQDLHLYVKQKTATIQYKAVGPEGESFGSVNPAEEKIGIVTGTAVGSVPNAEPGFRFVGWYQDEACTIPVEGEWVASDNRLTPRKTGELWTDAIYYAKFDHADAYLTITTTGTESIDENQSHVFTVEVKPADGSSPFNFEVAICGNGSETFKLPYGEYTVTENGAWNWRYADQAEQSPEIKPETMTATATFNMKRANNSWLNGCSFWQSKN